MISKHLYVSLLIASMIFLASKQSSAQSNILFTNQNAFLGNGAGFRNISGLNNVFLGYNAGLNSTSGQANVFIGSQAGLANTTGTGNLFLGQQAGSTNTIGSYNLFMGNSSGTNTTNGAGNTAIGDGAFLSNTTGGGNTSIGRYAGINMTTGSNNTFIGTAATAPAGSGAIANATAIGANASVTASNALVLGSNVNVGIGTSAPNNKLEITKGTTGQSGLRFTNLTSGTTPTISTNQFLTVNSNGDVVLALVGGSKGAFREEFVDSSQNVGWNFLADGNLQNINEGAVVIGPNITKRPSGYRLYVAEGILTEKVKVAIKTTDDWSDHVFKLNYQLDDLLEVERYIKANKHLPGVPSADEVVKQGIDVAKMDATLLAKIEELTLYSINLEKANQYLKESDKQQRIEIDELKKVVKKLMQKK